MGICSPNPPKYTLALMDALFSIEEMATKYYIVLSKSTKSPLLSEKKKLIEGKNNIQILNDLINNFFVILDCVNEKFGQGSYAVNIKVCRKANQKCKDIANKLRKTQLLFRYIELIFIQQRNSNI